MLTPGAVLKYLTRRFLPAPSPEGAESEGYLRGLRYGEGAVGSLVRKAHLLADEGSYFTANNAQTGIIEGVQTGFVVTAPTLYLANTADPGDLTARSIGVDYIDLSVQTAGATGTAVQGKALALYLTKGNNYSSGGTDLSAKVWAVNPRSAPTRAIAKLYFGALTTTDAVGPRARPAPSWGSGSTGCR
jgi:hypothetical protein